MKIILLSLLLVLLSCLAHFGYAQILSDDEERISLTGLDSEGAIEDRLREETVAALIGA
ncbi:hypothetical protein O3M35_013287 [Rhynocoris fuscipes]|uniref:Uncharacterized protein n=1 Tax=Rhynocoris fuscipes TaxID=488301 RepID=A0AAW1CEM3_9HEMI